VSFIETMSFGYSASKNGVTLKSGMGVFQIIETYATCYSAIVNMALSCTVFELFDVE